MRLSLLPASIVLAALGLSLPAGEVTFCNPLNLDYGWAGPMRRHSADPVIVLFKDRYYLFATGDVPGFRVSDDLLTWKTVEFPRALMPLLSNGKDYCAPAAAAQGDWLYFMNMNLRKDEKVNHLLRTRDPMSGQWQKVSETGRYRDPTLFFDDDGRIYLYHGLGAPTRVVQLDPATFREMPGTDRQLRPQAASVDDFVGGYERGRRELVAETDTSAWLDKFAILPCQEAAWMTKRDGRYYLQYATPGTVTQWHCDAVMHGDSPTGPFTLADYSPASLKAGGFIGSAGHSCVFQDKHGNWWRVTTMWVGVDHLFERRLGMFPVEFDSAGRMYTPTAHGDYPQVMPAGKREPNRSILAGWNVLSYGKVATASSSLERHAPELAADENIRTWWSARTGQAGEWFQVDLGKPCRVDAVQINFAEQDTAAAGLRIAEDYHRYCLLASADGSDWQTLADHSARKATTPHDYLQLPAPLSLRYLKVVNVSMPAGGKFALRDLRVFGQSPDAAPAPVNDLRVTRHANDRRNVTFEWTASPGADGYLVRYGIAPNALHLCIQVQGGTSSRLTLHTLHRGVAYHYRVDAFNGGGATPGRTIADR